MEASENTIKFSVVMPTRDRPELFKLALDSVLAQKYDNIEIHVVNDGSSGDYLEKYKVLENEYQNSPVTFHYLTYRPNGHGQSYSMNYGAYFSDCDYLCFLDDDDFWIDDQHLSRAAASLTQQAADLYFTNQIAYFSDGRKNEDELWIQDLEVLLQGQDKDESGSYQVDLHTLLKSQGFAHLNCSIYSKDIYHAIEGMDEHIRYECDRDIYIRAIDQASKILYNPAFISQHHIPDQKKGNNMSTAISIFEKKLFQLRVYEKGILFSKTAAVRNLCLTGKGNELKRISEAFAEIKQNKQAYFYAKNALATQPSVKWMFYTFMLFIKSVNES